MSLTITAAEVVQQSKSALLKVAPWWERVRLGDIATVQNGAAFKSSEFNVAGDGMPLIRIRDVGADDTATFYAGPYGDEFIVDPGDLLIGMDGDFRIARWRGSRGLLNQRVCRVTVIHPDFYDERFLLLCVQPYLDEVQRRTSSITVKHLSSSTVAELPIPLPPRAEQHRLADELERRLSHVDAAKASTRRAQHMLVSARRAVLNALANGSLAGQDSNGWPSVATGDICEVRGGIQKQPKRKPVENRFPFLRVANVGRGKLDLAEVHEIELFGDELDSYRLEKGDLLVVEGNGSIDQIGRAAMWDGSIDECVHQNHLIRVRPGADLSPEFLALVWNAPSTVAQLVRVASSTSGLHTLSTGKVKQVKLRLPDLRTQTELVAEAERRLSLIDAAERTIATSQAKTEQLRRSLLAAAFNGRLVTQDPDDEPASELLERISPDVNAATRTKTAGRKKKEAKA